MINEREEGREEGRWKEGRKRRRKGAREGRGGGREMRRKGKIISKLRMCTRILFISHLLNQPFTQFVAAKQYNTAQNKTTQRNQYSKYSTVQCSAVQSRAV
jgi:hypothetical protein